MLHPLKQFRSAAFAALMLCFHIVHGVEIDLLSLLPSHTAVAGHFAAETLPESSFFRQHVPAGVKKAAFGCDARGRRIALLAQFTDENAWQKMWDEISPHLEPLPAERRILLYKVKGSGNFFRDGHFAVLAPMVAAYYTDFPGNQPFKCDYSGVSGNIRQLLPENSAPAVAGLPRFKDEAVRQIREFAITLSTGSGNECIKGHAVCRKPIHASWTHFALLASCSMYLQQFCALSPEDAAEIISLIKVRQNGARLDFEFSAFDLLLQKMNTAVKF